MSDAVLIEIDDDPEDHIVFDRGRIEKIAAACDAHLADLRRFELWPYTLANPDLDRWPVFRAQPHRASYLGSPAALCAKIGGAPRYRFAAP